MGTTYKVYEKRGLTIEFDEHSERFSIGLGVDKVHTGNVPENGTRIVNDSYELEEAVQTTCNLTPADLVALALETLKVASYFGFDNLSLLTRQHMESQPDGGYIADVVAQVSDWRAS